MISPELRPGAGGLRGRGWVHLTVRRAAALGFVAFLAWIFSKRLPRLIGCHASALPPTEGPALVAAAPSLCIVGSSKNEW